MNAYEDIKMSRRLVVAGAAIGYLLAAAALVLFVVNINDGVPGAGWQVPAWMVILVTPPTWALLSLDRRPSLLAAATFSALALTLLEVMGGLFLPVHLLVAITWIAASRRRPRPATDPAGSAWKRPLMAMAIVIPALLMYAHVDPVCELTGPDGQMTSTVDATAPSGWRLGMSISTSSGTSSGSDVEEQTCWNDSITWWEGLAGLVSATMVMVLGWRWPTNGEIDRGFGTNTLVERAEGRFGQ